MKLSKRTLFVIGAGVFIIILGSLGMVCSQRVSEKNELNDKLGQTESRLQGVQLDKLSSQQAELEKQLSQTTSQFEAVRAILSQPVGSITASSILFDIAEAHGLEVIEITSPGPASDSLEGVTCSVTSITARIEGDLPNLISFVTKLNNHLTTGVIKSITITMPETTSGEKVSADIKLVVYAYRGD